MNLPAQIPDQDPDFSDSDCNSDDAQYDAANDMTMSLLISPAVLSRIREQMSPQTPPTSPQPDYETYSTEIDAVFGAMLHGSRSDSGGAVSDKYPADLRRAFDTFVTQCNAYLIDKLLRNQPGTVHPTDKMLRNCTLDDVGFVRGCAAASKFTSK